MTGSGDQSIIACEFEEEYSLVLYMCFICWRGVLGSVHYWG